MKVILLGASGAVGNCVLKEITSGTDWNLVCIARAEIPGFSGVHWKISENIEQGISDSEGDVWICCLGTTIKKAGSQEAFQKVDYELVKKASERAAITGASQFHVISAMGANTESRIFYNRVKGNMENAVSNSGIPSICIYRPSLIGTKRKERRWGERIALKIFSLLQPLMMILAPDWAIISDLKIAKCIINRIKNPRSGILIIESGQIQKDV